MSSKQVETAKVKMVYAEAHEKTKHQRQKDETKAE